MENITLGKKYKEQFLESDKKNKDSKIILEKIILKEEEYKWSCVNWTRDQVKDFLRSLKSTSPNSISKAFSFLRNLITFICKQEKIEIPEIKIDCHIDELVNYDKILSEIVSYEELKNILHQIDNNNRIKCIIELAWLTLTNDEIKNLKKEDVEFKVDDILGIETAILKLSEDRYIVVEDQEIINDLKICKTQMEYKIKSKDNISKIMKLKDSEYLIKPVLVGKNEESEELKVTNPSQTMQNALKQQDIKYKGINVGKLTIENIRKSKIVYMLHNKEFFNKSDIIDLLGGGNKESYLYWLEKLAAKKYNTN